MLHGGDVAKMAPPPPPQPPSDHDSAEHSDSATDRPPPRRLSARAASRTLVERSRTPSSIPSKCQRYKLVPYPQIVLEYQMPNSPEKYLLPIRFPRLFHNIVRSLLAHGVAAEATTNATTSSRTRIAI